MRDRTVDIFISGGGLAGLIAAAAFESAGFSVLLADNTRPSVSGDAAKDLRSTAFLQPARQLFEQIGIWDTLAPQATPLKALRIVDTFGDPPEISETRTFDATDLGHENFGWNLPNRLTRDALLRHAGNRSNIALHFGAGIDEFLPRTLEVRAKLTDGTRVFAKLAIGADGRESAVRDTVGIATETIRYGQRALAFMANHTVPHHSISTEIYSQGGAFTTVPLSHCGDGHASAVVWMNTGPKAAALTAMSEAEFNDEMTVRSVRLLGRMERNGPLQNWPVITRRAKRLTAERTALIAEAAHVLPPIGAQGLNTSLHDIATLYELAYATPDALGSAEQLDRYERARTHDIALRIRVIDGFNRLCRSGSPVMGRLRSTGLKLVHDITPIRKSVMNAGIGRR